MINREKIEQDFNDIEYLYHYTKYSSFKKIIESRALKFNHCNNLNDPIESKRSPTVKYYVSSFTFEKKESIPLWHMYAGYTEGIRIGIKNSNIAFDKWFYIDSKGEKTVHSIEEIDGVQFGIVRYDDVITSRSPSQGDGSIILTNIYDMGLYKGTAWDFEKEARYFALQSGYLSNIHEIYFELNDSFFENIQIVFSPFISDETAEVYANELKSLLKTVNIEESELKGKIRITNQ